MKMKQLTKRFLSLILAGTLLTGTMVSDVGQITAVAKETTTETTKEEVTSIRPLMKSYDVGDIKAVGGIKPYSDCYYGKNLNIKADLSKQLGLVNSLNFSNKTKFSKVPKGFDPKKVLEWGKYPGLNIDILQKYGFTGKGAVVAYVDQPVEVKKHEQYKSANIHYKNNTNTKTSLHGPAVLSLLAGKDTGTAPKAEVYYYAIAGWEEDQKRHAEGLYQIIEQNKKLSKNKKITMIGFSDNIDSSEKNEEAFKKAVKACEDAGIMVWFCGDYGEATFIPDSDKNNFENLAYASWETIHNNQDLVYVPGSGRTTAYEEGNKSYIYWREGGLSWTMPYMLGLYGIVKQIDPSLTQKDIRKLVVETAYVNTAGMRIVDPVEFVCTVLDKVGKKSIAKKMRKEVKDRQSYTYAIMNTALISQKDIDSISQYLSTITDSSVLVVDAAAYANVKDLYEALGKDHKERGGKVAGIQIFGTPQLVPTFEVSYRVQMEKEVDEGGTVLTDYFYGNFNNDAGLLDESYSVLDHFKDKKKVDLVPQWPVARLPLQSGEFSKYFSNYNDYATKTNLQKQTFVNFSNPIFASKVHIDDMGQFLKRMSGEFKIKINYRLYGNQDGQYPVSTKVLGNFTPDNLKKENKKGTVEFIINSHGQENNIDQATFVNNKEKRKSFINSQTINDVLSYNYYYLDTWSCNNGSDMQDNLVTTALNGKCVGAFACTTIISNNGVDNAASLKNMAKSNFFYFYYNYYKAIGAGNSRSTSFYKAQKAYAKALLAESKKKIDYGANYQFNMYNLLGYENFGVLHSNPIVKEIHKISCDVTKSEGSILENGMNKNLEVTEGKPITDFVEFKNWSDELSSNVEIRGVFVQELDNEHYRIKIDCKFEVPKDVIAFDPPNGKSYDVKVGEYTEGEQGIIFDVPKKIIKKINFITINCMSKDDSYDWIFLETGELK